MKSILSCNYRLANGKKIKEGDFEHILKNVPKSKITETLDKLKDEERESIYKTIDNYYGIKFINDKYQEEFDKVDKKTLKGLNLVSSDCSFSQDMEGIDFPVYKALSKFNIETDIIIDVGCGVGLQSLYFDKCRKYIGIENDTDMFVHNKTNSLYFNMEAYIFFTTVFPSLNFGDGEIFVISNYVNDDKVNEYIKNKFKNHYIYYP